MKTQNFILAVTILSISQIVIAEETSTELKIHIGFFQLPGYTVNNQPKSPLYQGVKFHPDFIKLLNENPPALQEVREAEKYQGLSMLGEGIGLVGFLMLILDILFSDHFACLLYRPACLL